MSCINAVCFLYFKWLEVSVCGRIGHGANLLLHRKKSVAGIMIKFAIVHLYV